MAAGALGTGGDFQENMSALGWCLTVILSWAKFLFFCILPFGKQRTNKVQLCLRNLDRSVYDWVLRIFLFVSLVKLNEPEPE